jgi:hypothetical protein
MTTPKIAAGTLAVVVLAGIGVVGATGSSGHHSQAKAPALTPAAAVVTTPVYAPIDVVPAWVESERWTANPSEHLRSGRRHRAKKRHHRVAVHRAVPVARAPAAHVTRHATPHVTRAATPTSRPTVTHVGPSSATRTASHTSTSVNGTTTTRTSTTHITTVDGKTSQSTQTHVTVTRPGHGSSS